MKIKQIEEIIRSSSMFKKASHPELPLVLYSYRFVDPTVYSNPLAREIRGIIFDKKTGEVVARPYHKFFNFGEKLCTVKPNETAYTNIKFDGSLLTAFYYNGEVQFASKGSFDSWVVSRAKEIATYNIYDLVEDYKDYTIMFELLDPSHPIVIKYNKPTIALTGIRHTKTGEYLTPKDVFDIGVDYGIPRAVPVHSGETIKDIVSDVKGWQKEEGVVAYAESDICKVKSEWYLKMHSVCSFLIAENHKVFERRVRKLLINNELDDIYPMIPEDYKPKVDEVVHKAMNKIYMFEENVRAVLSEVSGMDRKEVAKYMESKKVPKPIQNIVFRCLNDQSKVREEVYKFFRKEWG